MDCSPPDSCVHGDSPGKNTGVGCMPFSRGLANPEIEPRSPTLQVDPLLTELPYTDTYAINMCVQKVTVLIAQSCPTL